MSTGITRGSSYLATLVLEYLCLTEEEGSLCPCGLVGIGGVDRVSFCRFGVESPDRPWLSLRRVGRTDHLSKCGDRIIPLEEYRYYWARGDRKSTRLNSSHVAISYAVFCLKKKKEK